MMMVLSYCFSSVFENMIGKYENLFEKLPKKNTISPLEKGDHPELLIPLVGSGSSMNILPRYVMTLLFLRSNG